jgi:cobalt-zinc-cadmium efflux system protein
MAAAGNHEHDHGHAHAHRATQRRALWISLVANAGFMVVEVVGGFAFNSLALLADAAHMLSDVAGLGIALVAQQLVDRRATARHSYGLQRAEVLGAQANGIILLAVAGWIMFEAVGRIGDPADVAGAGLLVVATLGLLVNVASAVLLARAQGQSLNMRGAFVHMAADAAGSVAAIAAGVAIVVWDANWVDPVASIVIAVLVLFAAWGLLRDTAQVLLEGTPRGMDPAIVEATLAADAEVEAVHHLHLWNLASDVPAMSAHIVLRGEEVTLHDAQASGDRLKALLDTRFGITHATLELECHPCDPAPDELGRASAD